MVPSLRYSEHSELLGSNLETLLDARSGPETALDSSDNVIPATTYTQTTTEIFIYYFYLHNHIQQ